MFSSLEKLLELLKNSKLSDEQRLKAIELMKDLRREGFSNRDITVLVGGRWKEDTVKKYLRGMKVETTANRDRVLSTVADLTLKGKTAEDVDDYLGFLKLLDSRRLTPETLLEFYSMTISKKVDVAALMSLQEKLDDLDKGVEDVSKALDTLESLESQGIKQENIIDLNHEALKYGGLQPTLTAIMAYGNLQYLLQSIEEHKRNRQRTINELDDLLNEYKKREAELQILGAYAQTAKSLMNKEYDLASLQQLIDLTNVYGGPLEVFTVLKQYGGIQALNRKTEELRTIINRLSQQINEKEVTLAGLEHFIERANRMIGEIEANQKRSVTAQIIYDLITSPDELDVDPDTFKRTTLHFLTGLQQYAKKKGSEIAGWEADVSYRLNLTIRGLTGII